MDSIAPDHKTEDTPHIRWPADDEENAKIISRPRPLKRTLSSSSSLSIRSLNGRFAVDPSVALPIQYRSV
jgi:hypothetical protein